MESLFIFKALNPNLILISVNTLIYMAYIIGIWMGFGKVIKGQMAKIKMINRLKARKREYKEDNSFERHLRKILFVTFKKNIEPSSYILVTIFTALIFFCIFIRTISSFASAFLSFTIVITPYLIMVLKIETIRRKSSFEGEKLLSNFLYQYRVSGMNIYKTIENVIADSSEIRISSRLLFKLLLEIRSTGSPKAIKEATDRFSYGINTNWSRMLASCIRISAESGTNVSYSIENILIQLREARQLYEERKRLNSESVRMVVFLAPLMYVMTVIMAVKYLDIPFAKFVTNQIYTEQGLVLLTFAFFFFILNLALIEIINNQRFDF